MVVRILFEVANTSLLESFICNLIVNISAPPLLDQAGEGPP